MTKNKTISTPSPINNNATSKNSSPPADYSLSSVNETIQTIDRLVQSAKDTTDPCDMNIEQIEGMLVKWTRIGHFLVETYQQMQGLVNGD